MNIFAVGLGGALGAVFRYLLGQVVPKMGGGFPLGTFAVNLIGCFAIGVIVGIAGRNNDLDPRLVLFLQTGICGGFTTFSTFSLEMVSLLEEGQLTVGILYVVSCVVSGILAIFTAKYVVNGWNL